MLRTVAVRTSVIASFLLILDSANLSLTNNVLNGAQQDYYYIVRGHETYPPSNPEDPRDCFSFTARLTKCLAHLALPSWKQAKQLAFSALDIASAMMRDKEQLFKLYAGGPRSRSHVPAEDRFLFCTLFSSELLMASQKGLVLKEPIEVDYDTGEYSRVMVYLISFVVTDIRDLDNELQALTDVLANKLHYTVIRYGIDGRTRQQLLASVNELAERLVQNYGHDPQCLLYLLFAGHGGGDATTGDLLWSGKPSTQSINLTQLQEYLCANLQCHLLLQYDMCNGGYAARTKQDATEILRPFPSDAPSQELLLACGIRETCPMGHESFTKDTIRDLWRCLDHDTPMTLDVLARLSQMQNMSSTASRIRIRLLGPRPIEIYPSVK